MTEKIRLTDGPHAGTLVEPEGAYLRCFCHKGIYIWRLNDDLTAWGSAKWVEDGE